MYVFEAINTEGQAPVHVMRYYVCNYSVPRIDTVPGLYLPALMSCPGGR